MLGPDYRAPRGQMGLPRSALPDPGGKFTALLDRLRRTGVDIRSRRARALSSYTRGRGIAGAVDSWSSWRRDWYRPSGMPPRPGSHAGEEMKDATESRRHAETDVNQLPGDSQTDEPATRMFTIPELEEMIALRLAARFTIPGPDGQELAHRTNQGMMVHSIGPDGFPSMTPVSPGQVAEVVIDLIQEVVGP